MRATSNKQASPQKSASPRSLSSEEPQAEPPLTRRRTREQDLDENEDADSPKIEETMEDDEDEAEVTRCVCTYLEYPGPPSIPTKSKDGQAASLMNSDVQNDADGLFIQCDTCKLSQLAIRRFCARPP
jgi:hypothetical protein